MEIGSAVAAILETPAFGGLLRMSQDLSARAFLNAKTRRASLRTFEAKQFTLTRTLLTGPVNQVRISFAQAIFRRV